MNEHPSTLDRTKLFSSLQKHSEQSKKQFHTHHPHVQSLLDQFGTTISQLRQKALAFMATSTLATSMFLTSPFIQHGTPKISHQLAMLSQREREEQFAKDLRPLLPEAPAQVTGTGKKIEQLIYEYWGIHAVPKLEGQQLNHSVGFIGAEQHLPRYPGDTLTEDDEYPESGITPATGAWSYFAPSQEQLTAEDIMKEKYYVAVQTLYLPEWNTNTVFLKNWYKYRKVLVVNTKNGKTIVCDIADAGPAKFTGKQFGGSPEVMGYLDLNKGMKKGEVLLFFIDDAANVVPLGPVEYNVLTGKPKKEDFRS